MKVKALIELHKEYSDVPNNLKESCGDGYLCHHNDIYRTIREVALDYGTKYRVGGTVQWHDYMVFPLVNFYEILMKKEVPYIDNFNVLRRLVKKYPDITLPEKFIRDSFKRNYVLHESSHCISHAFFSERAEVEADWQSCDFESSKTQRLVEGLLGEALANSVERLSSSVATSSTHIFLHVLNSFATYEPKTHELIQRSKKELGDNQIFKMLFITFFFNNLLGYEHSVSNVNLLIDHYASDCGINEKVSSRALLSETLLKFCRLNTRFRDETSVVYFTSFGLGDEYKSLTDEFVLNDENISGYLVQSAKKFSDIIFNNHSQNQFQDSNSNDLLN